MDEHEIGVILDAEEVLHVAQGLCDCCLFPADVTLDAPICPSCVAAFAQAGW